MSIYISCRHLIRYQNFIEWAKSQNFEGYTEKHHIKPKCIGGDDSVDNLITLSGRAHFTAHLLLSKAFPNEWKLKAAVGAMSMNGSLNSRQIEEARKYSAMSIRDRPKELHPAFGKTWNSSWKGRTHSKESKNKMSKSAVKRWSRGISEVTRDNMKIAAKTRMQNQDTRDKISKTLKGSKQSLLTQEKKRESMKGLKWWNNGEKSIRSKECPEGYQAGRIKWKRPST